MLHDAGEILAGWGKDPSLEGYQSPDPNRIRDFAAAVFAAIQKKNIIYSNPPATTTRTFFDGQRIRTADAIMDQRLGTCMDMTLLYTSCLEAIHLHPVLVLDEGHIFGGVWLNEDAHFEAPVVDDAKQLTSRMDNGHDDLLLVECTAMCSGSGANFDEALHDSNDPHLMPDDFELAIDVQQVRGSVKPLPSRIMTATGYQIEHQDLDHDKLTKAPVFSDLSFVAEVKANRKMTKRDVWENKLLDLSLRNIMLNLPHNASVMPLMAGKIDDIEDCLASGEEFKIAMIPE